MTEDHCFYSLSGNPRCLKCGEGIGPVPGMNGVELMDTAVVAYILLLEEGVRVAFRCRECAPIVYEKGEQL